MDPDMVRQQEEAEAASRSPHIAPEPSALLGMAQALPQGYPFAGDLRRAPPGDDAPPQQKKTASRGVWFTALLDTVLAVIGLSHGLTFGASLSLVPWQTLAAGALAGIFAGWIGTGFWLRLRHGLSSGRAVALAFLPTIMVTMVMLASMRLAERYWALAPREMAEVLEQYQAGVFILSGGALAAYLLALHRLWRSLRR